MQKYIRGLFHGNKETKLYLCFFIILFVLTAVTAIYAIVAHSVESGIIAIFAGVLGLVLMSSFSFRTIEHRDNDKMEQSVKNAEKESENRKIKKEENIKGQYLQQFSEKKLQSILKENKIKKVNAPVMVDYSEKYRIKECPAYIWRDKNNFYILLLEKQTRKLVIPLSTLKYIHYEPGIRADVGKDYQFFRESSFIGQMFGGFLPTYYNGQGRQSYFYKKNLYSIAPDIRFTNTSARNLMKILDLNVNIKHSLLDKEEYAQYYQILFQYNVLWKDGVIKIEEYRDKVKLHLKKIADNHKVSTEEYRTMIMKFLKYRWITDEYADFFIGYKEKSEHKK